MALPLSNSAEGGTNGETVTTANSGGVSGNAFDLVNIGGPAALVFDDTYRAHGGLSYKFDVQTSSAIDLSLRWTSLGAVTEIWGRLYLRRTANPQLAFPVIGIYDGSSNLLAYVRVNTTGTLRVADRNNTANDGAVAIDLAGWNRIEFHFIASPTVGFLEAKLFKGANLDGPTPDETITSPATRDTGSAFHQARFGYPALMTEAGENGSPTWLDDLQVNQAGYPGPVSEVPPTGTRRRGARAPKLVWTIEDLPVEVTDWRANVLAFGGYDQMAGAIPERVVRRHPGTIDVGAKVTAYDPSGAARWQGTLSEPPQVDNAMAVLQAEGPISRARRARDRRMYQVQDVSLFSDAHGAPHNFSGGTLIDGRVRKTDLYYQLRKDEAYPSTGDDSRYQFALWVPGSPGGISRVAGSIAKSISTVNAQFKLRRFTGPSGTVTDVATYGLDTADPVTFDTTISSPEDAIMLTLQVITAHTPTQNRIFRLYDLRVNGIAVGDTLLTSEIAADLGGQLGYDSTGVQSSGLNALPFDLASGSSGAEEGLFYLAGLTDWRCLILEDTGSGPLLDFGPWARTWTFLRQANAIPTLRSVAPYNRVIVSYPTTAGGESRVIVEASPDPLSGTPLAGQKRDWHENLTDAQEDDSLANQVANYLLPRVSVTQFTGRVEIAGARAEDGTGHVYSPRGGDVGEIADWGPAEAKSLRIWEVEYRPDGTSLGIEAPISAAGLMARDRLRRARQRQSTPRRLRAA